MIMRAVTSLEMNAYDTLAQRHGTLFNCSDWLALFGDNVQTLGIFEDGGEMVGGLSFSHEHRFGLKIVRNAPYTPTFGPFIAVKAQNPVAILETRRKVLECIVEYFDKENPAIVRLGLDQGIFDALPFFWGGYKVIPAYTYRLDLLSSLEQIRKNMSPTRRNDITKALRDGLTVRLTTDLDVVKHLCLATFNRQKMQINQTWLDAILFKYANSSNSYAFTTYRADNIPIATCFVVHDSKTAYYLIGGYSADLGHHGAGALAMFEAIKHTKELGMKIFDFEGSVIPAIERYFRGFGGELTPYFTVNKAWLPLEIALKLKKRSIF